MPLQEARRKVSGLRRQEAALSAAVEALRTKAQQVLVAVMAGNRYRCVRGRAALAWAAVVW